MPSTFPSDRDLAMREKLLAKKAGIATPGNDAASATSVPPVGGANTSASTPKQVSSVATQAAQQGLLAARPELEKLGLTVNWNKDAPGVFTVAGAGGKSMVITPKLQGGGASYIAPSDIDRVKASLLASKAQAGTTTPTTTTTDTTTEVLDQGKRAGNSVKEILKGDNGTALGYIGWDGKQYNLDGTPYSGPGTAANVVTQTQDDFTKFQADMKATTDAYFQSQQAAIQQLSAAGAAMMKLYNDQYAKALELLQGQLRQDPAIPQSVKLAIQELRKGVAENGNALLEVMNARGILRSGITADELRKLAESGNVQEQKMLAQWLDQQHADMTKATYALADMYAQSAGTMAQMYYQTTTAPIQAQMNLGQQLYAANTGLAQKAFEISSGLRKWGYEQDAAARAAEAEAAQAAARQQFEVWKTLLPYQLQTAAQLAQAEQDWARMDETQRHNKVMEGLGQAARNQAADWNTYLQGRNATADQVRQNTAAAVEGIFRIHDLATELGVDDQTALGKYLAEQVPLWNSDYPVNLSQVLDAIRYKFPTTSGGTTINITGGSVTPAKP